MAGGIKTLNADNWLQPDPTTAWHVWREIRERYAWPVALTDHGLYKCEPVFEQHDADPLVLRATEKFKEPESEKPVRYPKISSKPVFLGKTVG